MCVCGGVCGVWEVCVWCVGSVWCVCVLGGGGGIMCSYHGTPIMDLVLSHYRSSVRERPINNTPTH